MPKFLQTEDTPEKLAYPEKVWHHGVVNLSKRRFCHEAPVFLCGCFESCLYSDGSRGRSLVARTRVSETPEGFGAGVVAENSFALVGCFVSPGFDFEDFEMGEKSRLLKEFPQHKNAINQLMVNA